MSESVGLAIIGCGQIAQHHIRNSQGDPRVRWVACCDTRPEAVEDRAAEFGIPGRYTDLDKLLADPAVEGVIVATPPTVHVEPSVAAFEAGKHVLVEKPIGICAAEAEAIAAAQGDGLVGACCSARFRGTRSAQAVTAFLATGELGPVRRMSANVVYPAPEEFDATQPFFLTRPGWGNQGVLADWSCYDFDYLFGLTGFVHQPVEVMAHTRRLPDRLRSIAAPKNDVEVQAEALVRCADGVMFDYRRALFAAAEPRNQWWLECEHGALDLCMLPGTPQAVVHRYDHGVRSEPLVEVADAWGDIHGGIVIDFANAILTGRQPLTPLPAAVLLQRMTDAIYRSAAAGRAVEVT